VREGVVARLDGGDAGGRQSGGQKGDVRILIFRDGLDFLSGIVTELYRKTGILFVRKDTFKDSQPWKKKLLPKTGAGECFLIVLGKTLRVKRGLKMLKSQRKVEDIGVCKTWKCYNEHQDAV
jgi:hypothetical protein